MAAGGRGVRCAECGEDAGEDFRNELASRVHDDVVQHSIGIGPIG